MEQQAAFHLDQPLMFTQETDDLFNLGWRGPG